MADKNPVYLTKEGLEELKKELDELINVKRPANIQSIKEARALGDLSENADYDAARNEQARIEARIAEIETIIKNVKIIRTTSDDIVNIGKQVKVEFVETKKQNTFSLVGSIEANPMENKISVESPLGKAMLNKVEGDEVEVKTETGRLFKIKILEIE